MGFAEDNEWELYSKLSDLDRSRFSQYEHSFTMSVMDWYEKNWLDGDGDWKPSGSVPKGCFSSNQKATIKEIIERHG
jgi:hypothetical protein